ncbi:MAG: molybdopterin molybdotransferase MoeA [Cyanobacteriota bacterium]|nr:molybdopterin molybdotransferase MoeA [Cyanobacteriota bacterium]
MLKVKQAESIILELVKPLDDQTDVETVELLAASDRILAAPVTSKLDFPHWDNSAMDGYAVRFADVKDASGEKPIILEIVEEIAAGDRPQRAVDAGQAARIFTGACMPEGADTVVMQEETRRSGDRAFILSAPKPQEFVRHQGAFYRAGEPLLTPGLKLGPAEIAVLAGAQCTEVPVYRRPRVVIFSTGDELVEPHRPLAFGQLVDSNQYALAAAVESVGAEAIRLGIVPDKPELLRATVEKAIATGDFVLSTGGVSVGDYDYVEDILQKLGGDLKIRSVAVKPGKPLTVASFANSRCVYFGLPGNPVSALVSFWRFVRPALLKLAGVGGGGWMPEFVEGRSLQELRSLGKRETYLWGKLHPGAAGYEFELAGGSHSSGNLINLAGATGLAIVPEGQTSVAEGELVRVLKIN